MQVLTNQESLELLKQTIEANPVAHGIDFNISFNKDVVLDDHDVNNIVNTIIEKITKDNEYFKDIVAGFIGVSIIEYTFYHINIFLISKTEILNPGTYVEERYNVVANMVSDYQVHVQSNMDHFAIEERTYMGIPSNTDLRVEDGLEQAEIIITYKQEDRFILFKYFTKE